MSPPFIRANGLAATFHIKNFCVLNLVCVIFSTPGTAHAGGLSIKSLSEFVTIGIAGGVAATRVLMGDELSVETNASQNTDVSDNILLNKNPIGGLALRTATDISGSVKTKHRTRSLEFHADTDRVKVVGPGDPGNLDSDFGDNTFYSVRFNNRWKRFSFNLNASQSLQNAADAQSREFTIPRIENGEIVDPSEDNGDPGDPSDPGDTGDTGDTGTVDAGGTGISAGTADGGLLGEGLTSVNASQESFTIGGNVSARINQKNTLTFSSSASQQTFDGSDTGDLVDSKRISTSGAWTTRRSNRTSLTASVSNLIFRPTNGGKTRKLETAGSINTQLSNKLNLSARAGAAFVSGAVGSAASGGTGSTGATSNSSGSSVGFVGNFSLSYKLKKTSVYFDAARSVSATSTGGLNTSDSAGIQINHNITRNLDIDASANYSVAGTTSSATGGIQGISSPGSTQLFIRVSPTYSVDLNRKWSADMSYEFRYRNRNAGKDVAKSNGVFVAFRRSLPVGR